MRLALNFRLSALFQSISATDGFDSVGQFRRHSLPCCMDSLSPSYSFPRPTCLKCLIWYSNFVQVHIMPLQLLPHRWYKASTGEGRVNITWCLPKPCSFSNIECCFKFYSSFLPIITKQFSFKWHASYLGLWIKGSSDTHFSFLCFFRLSTLIFSL